jgi:uncharacterized protein
VVEKISTIKSIVKRYIDLINQNNIAVQKVYLFGSYSNGEAGTDSDIDIEIISSDFTGDRFDDRKNIVCLRRNIDRRIEPIPYKPEDFRRSDPLVNEILKSGIEII